jgi:hypothetical protein
MQRLGLFVGEQNNWTFFREIAADLGEHYRRRLWS